MLHCQNLHLVCDLNSFSKWPSSLRQWVAKSPMFLFSLWATLGVYRKSAIKKTLLLLCQSNRANSARDSSHRSNPLVAVRCIVRRPGDQRLFLPVPPYNQAAKFHWGSNRAQNNPLQRYSHLRCERFRTVGLSPSAVRAMRAKPNTPLSPRPLT